MNSSIEMAEAAKLAQKLIDRTIEGKLYWEAVELLMHAMSQEPPLAATTFSTRLEPNLRATVGKSGGEHLAFSLVENPAEDFASMTTSREKVVIDVAVERDPPYGYDSKQDKLLATLLVDLYAVARRSALKMDTSVEKALSYLDRIAG